MRKGNVLIVAIHEDDIPRGFQWPGPSLAFGVTQEAIDDVTASNDSWLSWKAALGANVVECLRMLAGGISGRLGIEPSHPVVDAIAAMRTGAPYIGGDRH